MVQDYESVFDLGGTSVVQSKDGSKHYNLAMHLFQDNVSSRVSLEHLSNICIFAFWTLPCCILTIYIYACLYADLSLVCLASGYALSSVEGRVSMEFFDLSESAQSKKYVFLHLDFKRWGHILYWFLMTWYLFLQRQLKRLSEICLCKHNFHNFRTPTLSPFVSSS